VPRWGLSAQRRRTEPPASAICPKGACNGFAQDPNACSSTSAACGVEQPKWLGWALSHCGEWGSVCRAAGAGDGRCRRGCPSCGVRAPVANFADVDPLGAPLRACGVPARPGARGGLVAGRSRCWPPSPASASRPCFAALSAMAQGERVSPRCVSGNPATGASRADRLQFRRRTSCHAPNGPCPSS